MQQCERHPIAQQQRQQQHCGIHTAGATCSNSSELRCSPIQQLHCIATQHIIAVEPCSALRTCTPTNLITRPSSSLIGVMVSRFQNGVPSLRSAPGGAPRGQSM